VLRRSTSHKACTARRRPPAPCPRPTTTRPSRPGSNCRMPSKRSAPTARRQSTSCSGPPCSRQGAVVVDHRGCRRLPRVFPQSVAARAPGRTRAVADLAAVVTFSRTARARFCGLCALRDRRVVPRAHRPSLSGTRKPILSLASRSGSKPRISNRRFSCFSEHEWALIRPVAHGQRPGVRKRAHQGRLRFTLLGKKASRCEVFFARFPGPHAICQASAQSVAAHQPSDQQGVAVDRQRRLGPSAHLHL